MKNFMPGSISKLVSRLKIRIKTLRTISQQQFNLILTLQAKIDELKSTPTANQSPASSKTSELLDRLEAVARAATPGPWAWASDWDRAAVYSTTQQVPRYKTDPICKRVVCSGNQNNDGRYGQENWSGADWNDAKFIAAANPTAVLELIALARKGIAAEAPDATCTCPSGDGSLRWPCPKHPPVAPDALPPLPSLDEAALQQRQAPAPDPLNVGYGIPEPDRSNIIAARAKARELVDAAQQAEAAPVASAEPIYQVQHETQKGSSAWHDATESAYHTFMPERRRIVYSVAQSAPEPEAAPVNVSTQAEVSTSVCPKCGKPWADHDSGVPQPYCP